MKTTNPKFGDFYESESRRSGKKVSLDEAESESRTKGESVSNSLYQEAKDALMSHDHTDLAEAQIKLIQRCLQSGESVVDNFVQKLRKEIGTNDSKFLQAEGWINGVKSVYKYVEDRRKELKESEIVESYELSFNVDWDVKAGVDVVERLKLDEQQNPYHPYQINLVQIKTSEQNDQRGPEGYHEKHKKLLKKLKGRNFLISSLLREKGGLIADRSRLADLEAGGEKAARVIAEVLSNTTSSPLEILAENGKKESFTRKDAQELVWQMFTTLTGEEEKTYFSHFCALITSGSFSPVKPLNHLLETEDLEEVLSSESKLEAEIRSRMRDRLEAIKDKLEQEIGKIKQSYEAIDYYATSRYYVSNIGWNARESLSKDVITDKNGNPVSVQTLNANQDKIRELYDRFKPHA